MYAIPNNIADLDVIIDNKTLMIWLKFELGTMSCKAHVIAATTRKVAYFTEHLMTTKTNKIREQYVRFAW